MLELKAQYNDVKKKALDRYFSHMNPMQREAVFTVDGPVLILAGAGSGKTTVLINRVLNLVRFGDAYFNTSYMPDGITTDDMGFLQQWADGVGSDETRMCSLLAYRPVRPWNILAITFTNKAAGELRERLAAKLGDTAKDVNAATFHSACVRILRRDIERVGYAKGFTIYDSDDSIRVIKKQMDVQKVSDKNVKPRSLLSAISHAKDKMATPQQMLAQAGSDYFTQLAAKVYAGYQQELKGANALDFDDIILLAVRLLETCPDVLDYYQKRFRYIMVDEYQDTNALQYRLVSLLSAAHNNLCVVGDDDQSIYKFRGATIENILSFEGQFPGAKVIRLEQNYRSTSTILGAANEVIKNNTERKGKNLWTENGEGEKVCVYRAVDESGEADYICDAVGRNVREGEKFSAHAVLYRMNAQSNTIERAFARRAIPYKIIGGLRFYERKEVKDILAYMSLVSNPADNLRLLRIINEPKRGIGDATVESAAAIADGLDVPLIEVLRHADEYPALIRKALSLIQFADMIDGFIGLVDAGTPIDGLFDSILEKTGYLASLRAQGETEQARIENLGELKSNIQHFMQENEEPSLGGFLEEIALYTDIDSYNDGDDRVVLMTIHSAKGLEFDHVFLAGAEEGIFPGSQAIYNPDDIQEERRLAYVALTRARKMLHVTCCGQRMLFGSTSRNEMSRFVREIPEGLRDFEDATAKRFTLSAQAARHVSANPAAKKYAGKNASIGGRPATAEAFAQGEQVEHPVYGAGQILSVKLMGGDQLLEIAFDTAGTKKVMANYAKLKKVSLEVV